MRYCASCKISRKSIQRLQRSGSRHILFWISGRTEGPTDGHGPGWFFLLILVLDFDLSEQVLRIGGNIEDFDTGISGNSQPLESGVEDQGVDDGLTFGEYGSFELFPPHVF